MDSDTVRTLGGIVTKVSVAYSRKMWGDIGGSLGAEVGMEADVAPGADAVAVANGLYELCKDTAASNMKPALEAMKKPQEAPKKAYMLPSAPGATQTAPEAPAATQAAGRRAAPSANACANPVRGGRIVAASCSQPRFPRVQAARGCAPAAMASRRPASPQFRHGSH